MDLRFNMNHQFTYFVITILVIQYTIADQNVTLTKDSIENEQQTKLDNERLYRFNNRFESMRRCHQLPTSPCEVCITVFVYQKKLCQHLLTTCEWVRGYNIWVHYYQIGCLRCRIFFPLIVIQFARIAIIHPIVFIVLCVCRNVTKWTNNEAHNTLLDIFSFFL